MCNSTQAQQEKAASTFIRKANMTAGLHSSSSSMPQPSAPSPLLPRKFQLAQVLRFWGISEASVWR